ncbi:hypothetical protein C8R43DRAFT_959055 [Mycena crocata]|nr:hypothetical protein C8R43DRAFT_959055 [Mycena crocata]
MTRRQEVWEYGNGWIGWGVPGWMELAAREGEGGWETRRKRGEGMNESKTSSPGRALHDRDSESRRAWCAGGQVAGEADDADDGRLAPATAVRAEDHDVAKDEKEQIGEGNTHHPLLLSFLLARMLRVPSASPLPVDLSLFSRLCPCLASPFLFPFYFSAFTHAPPFDFSTPSMPVPRLAPLVPVLLLHIRIHAPPFIFSTSTLTLSIVAARCTVSVGADYPQSGMQERTAYLAIAIVQHALR